MDKKALASKHFLEWEKLAGRIATDWQEGHKETLVKLLTKYEQRIDALEAKIAALAAAPSVPAGWQLVPIEPTEEMLRAGEGYECDLAYSAMLDAAPEAPQQSPKRYETALVGFKECRGDEEENPLERLRFFCSLAMDGQDWLDAEQFFDDVAACMIAPEAPQEDAK